MRREYIGGRRRIALNRRLIRDLPPASFSLVMATEIIANACSLEGLASLARILTFIGAAAFAVIAVLLAVRILLYPKAIWIDVRDYRRGVGFFTLVAGIAVLGTNLDELIAPGALGPVLWVAALILWVLLIYGVFAALIVRRNKPAFENGMHAGWLLAVVATEAIAQFTLMRPPGRINDGMVFLAIAFWLCGIMLYIWMISLIFYRYMFFVMGPSELLPSYWIDMGGMGIASVAGALVAQHIGRSALAGFEPFVIGLTIFCWATATWWIPMLTILFVWRHGSHAVSFRYDPLAWGAVFPLGTYAVATWHIAHVTRLSFLFVIPHWFVFIALAAWALTALAMVLEPFRRSSGVSA